MNNVNITMSYGRVKACVKLQTFFRNSPVKEFLLFNLASPLVTIGSVHLGCSACFQPQGIKSKRWSDLLQLSEPDPAGRIGVNCSTKLSASYRGFSGFAYRFYKSLIQSSHNLASGESFKRKVSISIHNPSFL